MSAITVGGELVHYEVLGGGRPVVLVHGWLGAWRYWIPTMQQLHMKYRVYAVDLFGFGDSSKSPHMYSIKQQADMLDEFMDQLGISRAAFIGHGLGAMIVAEHAFRHQKEKVYRAMLVSPPLFDVDGLENREPKRLSSKNSMSDTYGADPDRTIPSGTLEATIPSAGMMRAALLERAAARNRQAGKIPNPIQAASDDEPEQSLLKDHLAGVMGTVDLYRMLDICFSPKQIEHGKLLSDVRKTDSTVLHRTIDDFDAGKMLDTIQQLDMPYAIVHGVADKIIPSPSDAILRYVKKITDQEERVYLNELGRFENDEEAAERREAEAARLENLRELSHLPGDVGHFPMLEYERFGRLVNDFLEKSDVDDLGRRDRWRRRSR
ncbi:MAG: alpha/beta hydrolase [Chloroflexota bacterium]